MADSDLQATNAAIDAALGILMEREADEHGEAAGVTLELEAVARAELVSEPRARVRDADAGRDLMIVAGRVSQKMAPVLRQIHDQMMDPKWVISMGVCASSGGMFNNYALVQGVDQVVPVDVYAPGCPPTPETLMHAILTLHEKVRTGELTRTRARRGRRHPHRAP